MKAIHKPDDNNLGFWEFAIIATLMAVFFPWSLLFCVVFYGLAHTKFIVLCLLNDLLKTFFAVLAVLVPVVGLLFLLLFLTLG